MGWMIRVLGFDSWWGLGILLFSTPSRLGMGPTLPPIQWVPGDLSLGVKATKVKNVWHYTSAPNTSS